MQVWSIQRNGGDVKVTFQGSLTNHSRAVNCVRFRGASSLPTASHLLRPHFASVVCETGARVLCKDQPSKQCKQQESRQSPR